jgi:hypothetical protein
MGAITFRGQTLKAAVEGAHSPTLGSEGNTDVLVPMARARALLFKPMAFDGIQHELTVYYFVTDPDELAGAHPGFYEMDEGDLVLPGFDTLNDCKFIGKPKWTPQQKVSRGGRRWLAHGVHDAIRTARASVVNSTTLPKGSSRQCWTQTTLNTSRF